MFLLSFATGSIKESNNLSWSLIVSHKEQKELSELLVLCLSGDGKITATIE